MVEKMKKSLLWCLVCLVCLVPCSGAAPSGAWLGSDPACPASHGQARPIPHSASAHAVARASRRTRTDAGESGEAENYTFSQASRLPSSTPHAKFRRREAIPGAIGPHRLAPLKTPSIFGHAKNDGGRERCGIRRRHEPSNSNPAHPMRRHKCSRMLAG